MIKATLDQYAATLNKDWAHDRSQTVGASEIGQCMRKTYWSKNEGDPTYGVERDPDYVDSWGAKLRGTIMENAVWAPAMKARYGDRIFYSGPDQVTFATGFLSATPDGLLTGLESDALAHLGVPELPMDTTRFKATITAECKTIDPRANLDEAKPANIFQTHVQMGLIREQTVYRPTHSLLSYMDASFWDVVTEFVIPYDPDIYAVAKDRATQIMTATSVKDMEPEGYLAGESECQYCPFTRACGVVRRRVPQDNEVADPEFRSEIDLASKAIAKLERIVLSETKRLRTLKQNLKDRLREKSVNKIPGVVSWSSVRGRKSYDDKAIMAAAVAAGIDIEQFAKRGESTDRLVVAEEKAA